MMSFDFLGSNEFLPRWVQARLAHLMHAFIHAFFRFHHSNRVYTVVTHLLTRLLFELRIQI